MYEKHLNELHEENEQLKNEITRLEIIVEKLQNKDFDTFVANMEDLQRINEEIRKENEQLKQQLNELKTYDEEDFTETEHINHIYKEKGFCGVIEYAKDKLQHYGVVKEV